MKKIKMISAEEIMYDQRVLKEAVYLTSLGYDVEIICWDREGQFNGKEADEYQNVKIKRIFSPSQYGSGLKQVKSYIKFILRSRHYLKSTPYDFLHCQNLDGFIAGYLMNPFKKKILDMREYYEGREKNKYKKLIIKHLVKFALKRASHIIYVNNTQIKEKIRKKLVFLPNYPSMEIAKHANKTSSGVLRVSYIGGVRQYNIFYNLFEAAKDAHDLEINIHGGGVAYQKLTLIESNYKNVNLTGFYNPKDTIDLYNHSDLIYCVYDMSNENWRTAYPIKFYESIITKTPVIVSKGSVLEDFLNEHDIGFVVDGNNIEDIKDLLTRLTNNPDLINEKIKTLEKIQFEYCWEYVVKNLDKIYK